MFVPCWKLRGVQELLLAKNLGGRMETASSYAQVIRGAQKAGKPVAVCGEMAGDVKLTRVLLGFGLRQFSMHPAHLLSIKQQVLRSDIEDVTQLAGKMLKTDDPDRLQGLLEKMNA